jgi:hypothetical protein
MPTISPGAMLEADLVAHDFDAALPPQREVPNLDQGFPRHFMPRMRGSSRSRSASPRKVDAEQRERDAQAGEDAEPDGLLDEGPAGRQHVAPGRRRRRHAQAEEAQGALSDRITQPNIDVASTVIGAMQLGRMWRNMVKSSELPITREAR